MAGVPAARWIVEEPLDYTWHDAQPQVLLVGEGHSLGKELRGGTAWQKPRTACDGKSFGKAPWRGGSQPRTQDTGHREARETSRAETPRLGGNNSSCVCSDPCLPKEFLLTLVLWEAAQRSTVNSPRSHSRARLHGIPLVPPAQDPSHWPTL